MDENSEEKSGRKLTIIRRKSLASCFDKTWFYIEDAHGNTEIACIRCKLLGELKNGKTGVYEIASGALRVIAVSGDFKGINSEHGYAYDFVAIPDDGNDVVLSGKRHFQPSQANAFEFDKK